MKFLAKMLVGAMLLMGCQKVGNAELSPVDPKAGTLTFNKLMVFIKKMNPQIEDRDAAYIANAIFDKADEHKLDPKRFASVIAQESHFRLNLKACYDIKDPEGKVLRTQCDLGLGQISPTWVKEWRLDKNRLQYDVGYNLDVSARILKHYKDRFPKDPLSYSRYFNGNRPLRQQYENLVNKRYKVMETIIHAPVMLASA